MDFHRLNVDDDEALDMVDSYAYTGAPPSKEQIGRTNDAIRQHVSKGNSGGALGVLVSQPPHRAFVAAATELFASTRTSDVGSLVKEMDAGVDCLVRYLFWAMEEVGEGRANGAVVLGWLEKVIEIEGNGAIVRCMTDRRAQA